MTGINMYSSSQQQGHQRQGRADGYARRCCGSIPRSLSGPVWIGLLLLAVVALAAPPATAQDAAIAIGASPEEHLAQGIQFLEDGDAGAALTVLQPAMQRNPLARDDERGTVGFWFGMALHEQGLRAQARYAWLTTVQVAAQRGASALYSADALIRDAGRKDAEDESLVTRLGDTSGAAETAFSNVLASLGREVPSGEKDIRRRHAALMQVVVPDALADRLDCIVNDACTTDESLVADVAAWWRGEDPNLETDANERVQEHVVRVGHALETYPWDGSPSGVDDRGRLLVRLGEPSTQFEVDLVGNSDETVSSAIYVEDPNGFTGGKRDIRYVLSRLGYASSEVPTPNEVWYYPELDDQAYYILVQKRTSGKPYLKGEPLDLLPNRLAGSFGNVSERSVSQARIGRLILSQILQQLLVVDAEFGGALTRLQDTVPVEDRDDPVVRFANGRTIGSLLYRTARETERKARRTERAQERNVPKKRSNLGTPSLPALPVAVRTARFLEEDGTTRTEVYWSAEREALLDGTEAKDTDTFALEMTVARYSGDYGRRSTSQRARLADATAAAPRLPTAWVVLDGNRDLHHVVADLKQFTVDAPAGAQASGDDAPTEVDLRAQIAGTRVRLDSIQALPEDRTQLVASDLRLLEIPDDGAVVPTSDEEARRRTIPFQTVPAGTKLMANLEVYNLTYDTDDKTRYTVEVESQRRTERGRLTALFRGDDEQTTATSSSYRTTSRRTSEFFEVTLPNVERRTEVVTTVQITDEVTGDTVERDVSYVIEP